LILLASRAEYAVFSRGSLADFAMISGYRALPAVLHGCARGEIMENKLQELVEKIKGLNKELSREIRKKKRSTTTRSSAKKVTASRNGSNTSKRRWSRRSSPPSVVNVAGSSYGPDHLGRSVRTFLLDLATDRLPDHLFPDLRIP